MRKFKVFGFLLVLALLATPAFALQCKEGNDASDECWTSAVLRATGENIANLIAGTIMVYDSITPTQHGLDPNGDNRLAFTVRAAQATTDGTFVAGVYQGNRGGTLSSGDRVFLQVRGMGKVRTQTATVNTGDRLYVSSSGNLGEARALKQNFGVDLAGVYNGPSGSTDRVVAWALEGATAAATNDAFIVIV
jgi:hypothetical protein